MFLSLANDMVEYRADAITKQQDLHLKNQNIYQVTEKGRALLPVLVAITLWSIEYDNEIPVSKDFIDRLVRERRQVSDEIEAAVKNGSFEMYRENLLREQK